MDKENNIQSLYTAFLNGQCSREMLRTLFQHFKISTEAELRAMIKKELEEEETVKKASQHEAFLLGNIHSNLIERIAATEKPATGSIVKKAWFPAISIAAAILIIISAGLFFYEKIGVRQKKIAYGYQNDKAPGGNKATLTLADGRKISLSNAANGELAKQAGIVITKTRDGMLVYTATASKQGKPAYNTIQTPKGGQYQINLPDGSKVWLNADASLRYPTVFNGRERKVELQGEAYFEIAANSKTPFIVLTAKQRLQVTGTHFNVSAYPEDKDTKTTLLEGSVKVSDMQELNSKMLLPNQQSILKEASLKVVTVDAEESIAWKKGEFVFNDEQLGTIMNNVARWYDMDISYQDDAVRHKIFNGTISRFGNVSKVLKMLELTGQVHFKIEGRTIIVNN